MKPRILPSSRRFLALIGALGALFAFPQVSAGPTEKVGALDKVSVAVTDVTPAGREMPLPSAQNPVYFVGLNAGYRVYAGAPFANDEPPKDKAMLAVLTEVLAKQHYLAADADHPATQILVCSWGTLESGGLDFLGGEKLGVVEDKTILRSIPLDVLKRRFHGGEAETVLSMSRGSLYAVLIRAYDLEKALKGDIVQLWETRISCSTPRTSLSRSLPGLVVAGQHAIGRETPRPIVRNAAHTPDAWVEIGESSVVEYIDLADLQKAKTEARQKHSESAPAETKPPTTRPAE